MTIEIKNGYAGNVIYTSDSESIRDALIGATKKHIDLCNADLCDANLRDANLCGANLGGAFLCGANLCDANLRDANLCGANLRDANLRDANLRDANLSGANLCDANLSGADLCDADLYDACLCAANLRGACLRGAKYVDGDGVEFEIDTILQLLGLRYDVCIFKSHIKIGCECHSKTDWWSYSDRRILAMEGKPALEFWQRYKCMIQETCKAIEGGES